MLRHLVLFDQVAMVWPGDPKDPSPAQPPALQPVPVEGDVVVEHLQEAMEDQRLVRQDYGSGECWFQGPPLLQEQKKLAPSIVRLHRSLGHPRTEDFEHALVQHGKMDPECINLARRLKCATCERTRKPLPPRPASFKAMGCFNDKICLDYVFLHDSEGTKHNYIHILEPAGGYNLFIWVPSRLPGDALQAFQDSCATWAGYPKKIWMDRYGSFGGIFAETLEKVSDVDYSAAEASEWRG